MRADGAIRVIIKFIRIKIERISQDRILIPDKLMERLWEQLNTFLGKDTQKLFKRFKRLSRFNFLKIEVI